MLSRLVLALTALILLTALPASAHSTLERSDPSNGGMAATGRTELTLWFSAPVTLSGSTFSVRSTNPATPPVSAEARLDEGNTVVHLTTPPLERDTYTISWAVVGDDGHPTQGTVIFGAGFRPDGVPSGDSGAPDPLPLALRLMDLTGMLLAVGALAVSGRVLASLARGGVRLRRRALTIGALGAATSFMAAVATPVLTAHTQLGSSGVTLGAWASAVHDILIGNAWGTLWLIRIGALAVGAVALWRARGDRPTGHEDAVTEHRAWAVPVAAGALIASAGLDAWAGHASTLPARSGIVVVASTLHVLAAGVWAGGLITLVLSVVPVMRLDRRTRGSTSLSAWQAYSPMAAISAGMLVATGIYETGRHVETISSLWHSIYGSAVVAKVLLVMVALAIAGYHTLVVNRAIAARVGRVLGLGSRWQPRARRLATTVTIEALVLGVAVAVAAVMTSVPTSRDVDAAASVTTPYVDTVDNLFVTFDAVPTGSRLRLLVRAEPVVRPDPSPITGVEVTMAADALGSTTASSGTSGAGRLVLEKRDEGRYEAATTSAPAGDWTAHVILHRAGRGDSIIVVPWTTPSNAPTRFELATTGASLALLIVIGVVLVSRRRSRGPDARTGTVAGPESVAVGHGTDHPASGMPATSPPGSPPASPPDPEVARERQEVVGR